MTDDSTQHPDAWLDEANAKYAAERAEARQAGTPFTDEQRRTRRAAIRSEYDARAEAHHLAVTGESMLGSPVDGGVENSTAPVDNAAPFVLYVYVSPNWQLMPAIDATLALFAAEHAGMDVVLITNSERAVNVWEANNLRGYLDAGLGKPIVRHRRMIYGYHLGGSVEAGIVIATVGDSLANTVMQDLSDLGVPYDVLNFGRQSA